MSYTYLIGWSSLNKFYYGRRTSKKCTPSDLWVKYFTSSKVVKDYVEKYGDPDVIQIRKIFNDTKKCINWECKVLRRLHVANNEKWLNIVAGDLNWDTTGISLVVSETTKRKISETHLSRTLKKTGFESFEILNEEIQKLVNLYTPIKTIMSSLKIGRLYIEKNFEIVKTKEYKKIANAVTTETRNKISLANKGRIKTKSEREKLSNSHKGKIKSKDHIEKIKETKKQIRISGGYNYSHSEETLIKMRKPKSTTENYKKAKSETHKENIKNNAAIKIKYCCVKCKRVGSIPFLEIHMKSHEKGV